MASLYAITMQQPASTLSRQLEVRGCAGLRVARPVVRTILPVMQGVTRRRLVTEARIVTESGKAPSPTRANGGAAQRTVVSPTLASRWRQVCGSTDWENMLDPLDADVRNELIRYGEFAQACYDGFDKDEHSLYRGSCRYRKENLLERVQLPDTGYEVTKYLYTTTDIESLLLRNEQKGSWDRESSWAGYVAVCTDENRVKQLGRRDIVVAWRGTMEKLEWAANLKRNVVPSSLDDRETSDGVLNVKVGMEQGFLSLYTTKNSRMVYNKRSAREQLLAEIQRLIKKYDDDRLSITTTGHSLGAALALLSAYDMAESGINRHSKTKVPTEWNQRTEPTPSSNPGETVNTSDVPITCFSFAGPRVGNSPFADRVKQLGVKVLRVVNKNDFVPRVPGLVFSGIREELGILDNLIERLPWTYSHCGVELEINNEHSPFLKSDLGVANAHNLELYMHLVAGHQGKGVGTGKDFKLQVPRDIALVNKSSDALAPQKYIPTNWWQQENKGLVYTDFEWVQAPRNTEDIPTPEDNVDDSRRR